MAVISPESFHEISGAILKARGVISACNFTDGLEILGENRFRTALKFHETVNLKSAPLRVGVRMTRPGERHLYKRVPWVSLFLSMKGRETV